jgi:two-component system, chemotaxis family, response regulator Rcp1
MVEESGSNPSRGKEQPSISQSHSRPNQSVPQRFNLLLAEDNLPDALLVREAIRHENLPIDLHVVSDGQQAIDFIERAENDENAPCPQCMLLDLNLPKVEGFEILRRLRGSEKCGGIPVVVITSSDSPVDRSRAAALGAGYFRKPPSYEEFLKLGAVLKRLIGKQGAG